MLKIKIILIFFVLTNFNLNAEEFKFKKIASLDKPWGSSFINESELIISEKVGKIKIVDINDGKIIEVKHIPKIDKKIDLRFIIK